MISERAHQDHAMRGQPYGCANSRTLQGWCDPSTVRVRQRASRQRRIAACLSCLSCKRAVGDEAIQWRWVIGQGVRCTAAWTAGSSPCGYRSCTRSQESSFAVRSAEAENELRVVAHLVGRPRRVERELEIDLFDARNLVRDAVDVLGDERP